MTSSIGIAKPRPIDPDCSEEPYGDWDAAVRMEELIPTTAPVMSTSGPPELPGLIAASVWIAGYVVELPSSSEPTLTGRFERADDAAGDGGVEAERRADGDHALADPEVGGLADGGRRQPGDVRRP